MDGFSFWLLSQLFTNDNVVRGMRFDAQFFYLISGVFILGAKRTAFGTFGGAFKDVTGTQLQTAACKATLDAAGVRPEQVDSVVIGNVLVVSGLLVDGHLPEVISILFNSHPNRMEPSCRDMCRLVVAFQLRSQR